MTKLTSHGELISEIADIIRETRAEFWNPDASIRTAARRILALLAGFDITYCSCGCVIDRTKMGERHSAGHADGCPRGAVSCGRHVDRDGIIPGIVWLVRSENQPEYDGWYRINDSFGTELIMLLSDIPASAR